MSTACSLPAAASSDRSRIADRAVRRRRPETRRWLGCLGMVMAAAGCGDSKELTTYPTTVTVQDANGQPLAGVRVSFRSVEHKISALGVSDGQGVCQMTTYNRGDGAVAGRHQVAIGPPALTGDPDALQPTFQIPRRISSYDDSELEATVTDGDGPNELTFTVPAK